MMFKTKRYLQLSGYYLIIEPKNNIIHPLVSWISLKYLQHHYPYMLEDISSNTLLIN